MQDLNIDEHLFFPSGVYTVHLPQYLKSVQMVANEALNTVKNEHERNEIYPVYQTYSFHDDVRIAEFSQFVLEMGWHILQKQGHAMEYFTTHYESMWLQDHVKHSAMDQHIHGFGAQLVAFYFLKVPENGSRLVLHDPRPGKTQINLPQTNFEDATYASDMVHFVPREGDLYLTNAWLPHSFTRSATDESLQMVHMNITVALKPEDQCKCDGPIII